jgi:hypothetical protein
MDAFLFRVKFQKCNIEDSIPVVPSDRGVMCGKVPYIFQPQNAQVFHRFTPNAPPISEQLLKTFAFPTV